MGNSEGRPVFTPIDDGFHFDGLGDDWWATETSWFSFHHADSGLGGWLYTLARPNIGTVAGGLWVWDRSAVLPWEIPYCSNYTALQLPLDTDLTNTVLPNGVGITVLEPTRRYALSYDDPGRVSLRLTFDAVMDPEPMVAAGSTFGKARHFDQFGRVTGTVEILGRTVDIDCIAARDRTWGRRREDRPHKAAYVTGASSERDQFLAVTKHSGNREGVAFGFLRRDGVIADLVDGERSVHRDPSTGYVAGLELDLVDSLGRTLHATGTPVSRTVVNRHTFIDVNSLVRWESADGTAWGEDQDMWPVHEWADARRAESGAS